MVSLLTPLKTSCVRMSVVAAPHMQMVWLTKWWTCGDKHRINLLTLDGMPVLLDSCTRSELTKSDTGEDESVQYRRTLCRCGLS